MLRCNLNSRPRNRAFGAHHWNTHRITTNKHVKQEWCETNGIYMRKWLKTWTMIYLRGPKWLGNWASRANIQHTSKRSSSWHVHHDWCQTSGKFVRKRLKTGIFTYFGCKSGPKIGPLRTIFSTHLKVLAMSMWRNTDFKSVKTLWESDKTPQLWLTLGPKMAKKLGFWCPYCTNLWK